jgi:hypothetical protein
LGRSFEGMSENSKIMIKILLHKENLYLAFVSINKYKIKKNKEKKRNKAKKKLQYLIEPFINLETMWLIV